MAASAFLLDSSERPKHPLLKPKPIRLGKSTPLSSLIKDRLASSAWLATMQTSMANPFEVLTYFRPSNQLVLLLQKGTDFPVYPPELAECVSHSLQRSHQFAGLSNSRAD